MVFNIGRQDAGVINNVAGNQTVTGGQQGIHVSHADAQSAVQLIRAILEQPDRPALTDQQRNEVDEHLDAIGTELAQPQPQPERITPRITQLTQLLRDAGALVGAGAALVGPLTTLAHWLGAAGAAALGLLAL